MTEKMTQLRQYLADHHLDAVLIPRADEWQGEYVAPYAERLKFLTGFDGSAGLAVITKDKAALFVDGRYTVAAKEQIDTSLYDILEVPQNKLSDWLIDALPGGGRIGFDPWTFTASWIAHQEKTLCDKGFAFIATDINPVDDIWPDQPERPNKPVLIHDPSKAGKTSDEKCTAVAKKIKDIKTDALLVTAADNVAWLFNIRGEDVAHTPYVLARALVMADGTAELIIHPSRITDAMRCHLGNHVSIVSPDALPDRLHALGQEKKKIAIDPSSCPQALCTLLHDTHIDPKEMDDPCTLMKACKTKAEIDGSRQAHVVDAVALVKFFKWVEETHKDGHLTEITASDKLQDFRAQNPAYKDNSFTPIVGWNKNGAIVHYRVTKETSLPITGSGLLLVDSGGQYENGTTDITRTIALGTPTDEMKDRYTRVLKGHIALSQARFPKGTSGMQLDTLARQYLWKAGLDYAHGTGHGVGSYLSVHEGPAYISHSRKSVPLETGMILSNEPGYYKEGAYGIRFENLILVRSDQRKGDEQPMLHFETLSLFPVDISLLDHSLLSENEKAWINAYHGHVIETLAPYLDEEHKAWLKAMASLI